MRLSHFVAVLSSALVAAGHPTSSKDTFHETLTLQPLPDGKLSVLFEFTTHFSLHKGSDGNAQSHHSLTPPTLLLPLEKSNVSELTVSFTSGQWHQLRHGESGPPAYEAGGAGGDVRGWLRGGDNTDAAWDDVTHAFAGLFCATVGAEHTGESVRTFGNLFPPQQSDSNSNLSHYLVSSPHLHLCTENLTPFLSLLPSKGLSGLSALLAHPGNVLGWGFKTEGIDVVMPTDTQQGTWSGWWGGVVDLIPKGTGGSERGFTINTIFGTMLPRAFPGASSSTLRVVAPKGGIAIDPGPQRVVQRWIDGTRREVAEWDMLSGDMRARVNGDMGFWWPDEGKFVHPAKFEPPAITISRVAANRHASDATFVVDIANNADVDREAVYSEVWPWWVKGWLSEMTVAVNGEVVTDDDSVLRSIDYHPSVPPTPSTTDLHLRLTLPARSTVTLSIPFTKLTLQYDDHVPDAERGRELPASVLTLLDVVGEEERYADKALATGAVDVFRSTRRRVFGPKLLVDVPTPDFSMPYNVIIMTSTVMAVFFGSIQGRLIRRWGWVEKEVEGKGEAEGEAADAEDAKTQ